MQIEPNDSISALKGIYPLMMAQQQPARKDTLVNFKETSNLAVALQNEPEIRDSHLERALNLIGQVQWPPIETIRRIAVLLAAKM